MYAFVIADHLWVGRIAKEIYMGDYRYQVLSTLARASFDVIQNLTREKQKPVNYLFLKCSVIAQDKDFQVASLPCFLRTSRKMTRNRGPPSMAA